jgi:hypothetical protein
VTGDTPSDELADSLGLVLAMAVVFCFYAVGVLGMRTVSRSKATRTCSGTS